MDAQVVRRDQDQEFQKLKARFVLLRMTRMSRVNVKLFAFDFDQTWMSFFLDASGRIYARYGSRDAKSAESHNSVQGLMHAMRQVLAVHQAEAGKKQPVAIPLPVQLPEKLPAMKALGYEQSCIHCHMVHEARIAQLRKEGKFKQASFWLYPLPDNVGLKLDPTEGNLVREVITGSFAAKAGLESGDRLRTAAGRRIFTIADFQHVLNGLGSPAQLRIEAERRGRSVEAVLSLEGEWRRWDVSWRMSVRATAYRHGSAFARSVSVFSARKKAKRGIPVNGLAMQVMEEEGEVKEAGLRAGDIIVALDGKRTIPYSNPEFYPIIEHGSGEKMTVTFLRGGKEQTTTLTIP